MLSSLKFKRSSCAGGSGRITVSTLSKNEMPRSLAGLGFLGDGGRAQPRPWNDHRTILWMSGKVDQHAEQWPIKAGHWGNMRRLKLDSSGCLSAKRAAALKLQSYQPGGASIRRTDWAKSSTPESWSQFHSCSTKPAAHPPSASPPKPACARTATSLVRPGYWPLSATSTTRGARTWCKRVTFTASWNGDKEVIDLRSGKHLGRSQQIEAAPYPWQPALDALLDEVPTGDPVSALLAQADKGKTGKK